MGIGEGIMSNDNIAHPSHYAGDRAFEPIDVIIDWDLGFCLGNALKYISRAGRKDDARQDIQKAIQYLQFHLEKELQK